MLSMIVYRTYMGTLYIQNCCSIIFIWLQVRNCQSKVKEVQQSRFAEPSQNDMMEEDDEMDYPVNNAHAWGDLVKNDSMIPEQDNVSSSTAVPVMGYGNVYHNHCYSHRHVAGGHTMHGH